MLKHSTVVSEYADYLIAVSGTGHPGPEGKNEVTRGENIEADDECRPSKRRVGASMLDLLMWKKEGVHDQATVRKKTPGKREGKKEQGNLQQTHLDFGQKNFSYTTCSVCDMVYCPGDPTDEAMHASQHKLVTDGVEFW